MKKNGFTLMELLVVIILIGIILTLAIPSVNNILSKQSKKTYDTKIKLIEEATKLYSIKNRNKLLNINDSCIKIDYEKIKNNENIKEDDINCSGYIILTKTITKSFNYEYYLDCKNKNDVYFMQLANTPTNCTNFD